MSNVKRVKKAKSMRGERWKQIETPRPTLKMDYFISNLGRLKSVSKSDGSEHILTPTPDAKDYMKSSIKLEGGSYGLYIHMAVAKYWSKKPNKPGYNRYIHKDLDRLNNRASNIVWVTDDEWRDYVRARAKKYGFVPHRKGGKPKLKEKEVIRIKKHLAAGRMPKSKIAAKFGVSHTQINRIEAGENWAQLDVPGFEPVKKSAGKPGRPAAKKTTARKAGASKTAAKKTTAKRGRPAAKKTSAKKTTARKATTSKTAAKKTTAKRGRPAAKKTAAKKTTESKATASKTAAKKTTAKRGRPAAKKTTAKKTTAKKTTARKATASKTAAKKTTAKRGRPAAKKTTAKKTTAKRGRPSKKK